MYRIKKPGDLIAKRFIDESQKKEIEMIANHFAISITPQIADLIQQPCQPQNDPIGRQFIPSSEELTIQKEERSDPIGDFKHTPVKGVVHRYPDRCLLKPVNVCPVYCRFCFRKELIGPGNEALTAEELDDAYAYIAKHSEIWEVILTGGEPLLLKPNKLAEILQNLAAIKTIEILRIHTRVPVVDSQRINDAMIKAINAASIPVYIVIHANHPKEFTPKAREACAAMINKGIPLLSQSVLLKGINDNIETLSELMRTFIRNKIKPYYLHHLDLARGTSHFRVSIEEGQKLMQALRGRFSGLCQPTYVLDIPDGYGKVPLHRQYYQKGQENKAIVEDNNGQTHEY